MILFLLQKRLRYARLSVHGHAWAHLGIMHASTRARTPRPGHAPARAGARARRHNAHGKKFMTGFPKNSVCHLTTNYQDHFCENVWY